MFQVTFLNAIKFSKLLLIIYLLFTNHKLFHCMLRLDLQIKWNFKIMNLIYLSSYGINSLNG